MQAVRGFAGGGAPRKYPLRGEYLNLTKTDKRIKEQNITLSSEVVDKQKAFTIKEILKPFLSSSYDIPKEEYIFRPAQNKKKCAFTLAEVLITLGIIGIVAAMTLPALIANYNKRIICDRLKVAQTTISQMLNFAIADHGDPQYWDFSNVYGAAGGNETAKTMIIALTEKYFIPYLKVSKDFGYTTFNRIDYDGDYLPVTGTISNSANALGYILRLSNDVLIRIAIGTGCLDGERNPDDTCVVRTYKNIVFKVDINGFQKPNVIGKDVFNMTFDLRKKIFGFHNYGTSTRQRYLDKCKTDSDAQVCGYLIFLDGWEIKDDYPWF